LHAWRELPCILPLTCERSNTSQSCAAPNFIQACHNDHERGIYDQTKKKKKKDRAEVVASPLTIWMYEAEELEDSPMINDTNTG